MKSLGEREVLLGLALSRQRHASHSDLTTMYWLRATVVAEPLLSLLLCQDGEGCCPFLAQMCMKPSCSMSALWWEMHGNQLKVSLVSSETMEVLRPHSRLCCVLLSMERSHKNDERGWVSSRLTFGKKWLCVPLTQRQCSSCVLSLGFLHSHLCFLVCSFPRAHWSMRFSCGLVI